MNNKEFVRWLENHIRAYPSMAHWLKDYPDQPRLWEETLSSVPYYHAIAATKKLVTGEVEQPKGYSAHARIIRQISRELQTNEPRTVYHDGQEAYLCHDCMDTGSVSVWNPTVMRFLEETYDGSVPKDWSSREEVIEARQKNIVSTRRGGEQLTRLPKACFSVACHCEPGKRFAKAKGRIPKTMTYDPSYMVKHVGGEVDLLNEFFTGRKLS